MKFKLSAVVWKEGAQYVSKCPELEVASAGDSVEDAVKNLKEAVELYIENAVELNMKEELTNIFSSREIFSTEIEGEMNVAV